MSTGLYLPAPQTLWTYTYNGVDGWQQWVRPDWANWVMMEGVGPGGGGGGGATGAAGTTRGGGGGGASGCFARLMIPARCIGDVIYIRVGGGGDGGAAANAGTQGSNTWIAHNTNSPAVTPALAYLIAKAGGGANPGSSNGAAGGTGALTTTTEVGLAGMGIFSSTAGHNGTTGGVNSGAIGTQMGNYGQFSALFGGGTGGAGVGVANTNFAGGNMVGVAGLFQDIPGGLAAGGPGNGGLTLERPMLFTGGTGGGSNGTGTGGIGGLGAPGCGGGGGGGGVTGGRGGDGGPGQVWIFVW